MAGLLLPGIVSAQSVERRQPGNARLDVPALAAPGDTVQVNADGFKPGAEVQVFLMGPGPTARLLTVVAGSDVVDDGGRARWSVQLPGDLVPPSGSAWWLNADDAQGNYANVDFDFRIGAVVEPRAPSAPAAISPSSPAPLPMLRAADPRVPGPLAPITVPPPLAWAVVLGTAPLPGSRAAPTFVASEALRLRDGPTIDARLIGAIAAGAELQLLAGPVRTSDADYYHVRLPSGLEGFAAPSPEDVEGARPSTASASTGAYRLRAQPTTNAAIRTLLEPGATVRVLGTTRTEGLVWAHVQAILPVGGQIEGYLPNEALWPLGAV